MASDLLFADWLEGPEGRRLATQLEGCGIGERLWALVEAYRRRRYDARDTTTAVGAPGLQTTHPRVTSSVA